MPSKKSIFTPLSILFRPHQKPVIPTGFWWRRRVPPPGPIGLFHRPFIAIADPKTGKLDIVFSGSHGKGICHKYLFRITALWTWTNDPIRRDYRLLDRWDDVCVHAIIAGSS